MELATDNLEAAIIADLDKEVAFAAKTTAFYASVFERLKILMKSGRHAKLRTGVTDQFREHPVTAWFERPLLMAAALHRGILRGEYPELRRFYATTGGTDGHQISQLAEAIADALEKSPEHFLRHLATQRLQTNEVSRGVCWLLPLYDVWRLSRPKIALVELGCSAGLNLTADRYNWQMNRSLLYGQGVKPQVEIRVLNPDGSEASVSSDGLRSMSANIVRRIGYDLRLPDVTDADEVEMLQAMVWGDDVARMQRLKEAIRSHLEFRASRAIEMHSADAAGGLWKSAEDLSRTLEPGALVCLYNTVVTCYFDEAQYELLRDTIERAFLGLLSRQTCIWVEHESLRATEQQNKASLPSAQSYVRVHRLMGGSLTSAYVAAVEMHPSNYIMIPSGSANL